MTVSSTYSPVQYVGNGVATVFSFPYPFYNETDLFVTSTVISTGVSTVLVRGVDYSVSGGLGLPGSITILTGAPASTIRITIESNVPYTQTQDYVENSGFPAEVIERGFDKLTILSQQIKSRSDRALVVPAADSGAVTELPPAATRAGKALFFDASGNPSVTSTVDTVSAAAAAASASAAATSASAAATAQAAAEAAAVGIKWRPQVKAATTANITLSGAQTIDGISCIAGDRVLVKNQSTTANNGIYVVASGSWTRATDADSWSELVSLAVSVEQGASQADTQWICTSDTGGTLGVTAVTFASFLTTPRDASVTYAKVDPNAIASAAEIRSATASKLVDAAQLLTALRPFSTTSATTSGTETQFTSIPSGVRRIVVNFAGVSSNGTGNWTMELGDGGGYETSGYSGAVSRDGGSGSFSTAFVLVSSMVAADVQDGRIELTRGDSTTNTWHMTGLISSTTGPFVHVSAGTKSLSAELDRLRVVAGGNNWDAGKITCEAYYF